MPIKTLVIEDEEKSLSVLTDLIDRYAGDLEVSGSSGSVDGAVQMARTCCPQLVFLDIQIAGGSGFDVLRKLAPHAFEVIFVTAHEDFAVDAFRVAAVDYLLKPVGIPEFEEAVSRARLRISERRPGGRVEQLLEALAANGTQDRKIGIPTLLNFEFIYLRDILWCKSEGGYTVFHLEGGEKLISSRNLGSYEELLCAHNFFRIHNASIVNLRYVKSYVRGKSGIVVLSNGAQLEISQRRKGEFLERFAG